ncbi:MAG: hypothetical protein VX730_06595 [Pseudomonadota bacterium]|nr:hypothetical protein [Pseudomonadota bacterium]
MHTSAFSINFVAAGAPRPLVKEADWNKLFQHLSENSIHTFFPTFQYQEIPKAKSYGYEALFGANCSSEGTAFKSLKAYGIKLILPTEILYPTIGSMNSNVSQDPLQKVISCAGGVENIAGITSYDEAVLHGKTLGEVEHLYKHVKRIAPEIPVLMVHAPIVLDKPQFQTVKLTEAYLDKVKEFSVFSDIVGFDVYPVPALVAQVATPKNKLKSYEGATAVAEYVHWMQENLGDKEHLMVLQGFSYDDLYDEAFLKRTVPEKLRAYVNAPTYEELSHMVRVSKEQGVNMIVWWGQGSLKSITQKPWPSILEISAHK